MPGAPSFTVISSSGVGDLHGPARFRVMVTA